MHLSEFRHVNMEDCLPPLEGFFDDNYRSPLAWSILDGVVIHC
jgi:hypothetical protein